MFRCGRVHRSTTTTMIVTTMRGFKSWRMPHPLLMRTWTCCFGWSEKAPTALANRPLAAVAVPVAVAVAALVNDCDPRASPGKIRSLAS